MTEEEKSPTGQGRAEEVCTDKTNSPPTPSTQENSLTTLTRNKYGVIYADAPWSFRNWSAKATGRNAISHYDCLTYEELAALPIADLAAKDCALFLGAVDSLLDKAFELIRTWRFEYKAIGYWVDQNTRGESFFTGPGFWTRASPERCLLATRGKPKRWARDIPTLVIAPRISPRGAAGLPPKHRKTSSLQVPASRSTLPSYSGPITRQGSERLP